MSPQKKQFRLQTMLVPLVAFILLENGCSSMQVVDTDAATSLTSVVEAGDHVRITTREGEFVQLVAESVDVDRVSGDGQTVLLSQMRLLEIERTSPGRTLALIGIVTVAGLTAIVQSGSLVAVTW